MPSYRRLFSEKAVISGSMSVWGSLTHAGFGVQGFRFRGLLLGFRVSGLRGLGFRGLGWVWGLRRCGLNADHG